MRNNIAVALGLLALTFCHANGQSSYDPSTSETFDQAVAGMQNIAWYSFGTGSGSTISNLTELATVFNPYGIGKYSVQHLEWERYQPFNSTNFVFTNNSLNLVANIPSGGGMYAGGINSGQLWTKTNYTPNKTGHQIYAFMIRMKIPNAAGSWASSWFYVQTSGQTDGSEVDNPEFFVMKNQNQYDWTGFDHGPGAGGSIYDIRSNPWVWKPGIDFSAGYHDYEMVWTPDATYKYVDGQLIYAQHFIWSASGAAQMGETLAVGSSDTADLPGLIPTSLSEFPVTLGIQYIAIWAK